MFAFLPPRPPLPPELAEKVRPLATARSRILPVSAAWKERLPDGGLRRGSTIVVTAPPAGGGLSLAMSLVSGASDRGYWVSVVGVDDPGVMAMSDLGVDLRRVMFVPRPRDEWVDVVGDMLDGVDLVVLRPMGRPSPDMTRRIMGRVRERGAVLVVLSDEPRRWPLPGDVHIDLVDGRWEMGHHLTQRHAVVRLSGRGAARREREWSWGLPLASGQAG